MAKTTTERIASINEEILELTNQRKQLIQKQKEADRNARTKRLCKRAGLIESVLPETIPLTDEQFRIFLDKTLFSEYARKILNGLTEQNAATVTSSTVIIEQEYDEDESEYEDDYEVVTS